MADYALEDACGCLRVCGVDEVGRGPWAGPVIAAAVILDRNWDATGVDDSKRLAPGTRARLRSEIEEHAEIGIGQASVHEIDRLNVLNATMLAMQRAVAALVGVPGCALVDGNRPPDLPCRTETVVRGDARSLSIAAASIVAKVERDRLMAVLAEEFPGYGWERNAGYGTAEHAAALERLGVTPHHRKSFAPVARRLAGIE